MAAAILVQIRDPKMVLIFIITFLVILYIFNKREKNLPPGPLKLPFIGNLLKLKSSSPHTVLRDLSKKYGPLMHLKLGFIPTIVISTADVAQKILKTNDHIFCSRPKLVASKVLVYDHADIALAPYGDHWRQFRKICILELLSNKKVNSFRFVREEEVVNLVSSIALENEINLAEKVFSSNYDIVSRICFGKKLKNPEKFKKAMDEGTSLTLAFHIGDFFPSFGFLDVITGMKARLDRAFLELDGITSGILKEHVDKSEMDNSENEDLVDILLRLKASGELEVPITHDNIKAFIVDVFVGATENSTITIEWAMAEMMKNPKILRKAQAEIREALSGKPTVEETDLHKFKYMKMVIKETLRFHPPTPLLVPHESMENCMINGFTIPAKTRTMINYWAISRDPLSWENPDVFVPERFDAENSADFKGQNFEYIPFGAGRRICPGISFATVNMELALAALLYHFDWELPNGIQPEDLDMSETFGITMFKSSGLILIPTVHFPIPV